MLYRYRVAVVIEVVKPPGSVDDEKTNMIPKDSEDRNIPQLCNKYSGFLHYAGADSSQAPERVTNNSSKCHNNNKTTGSLNRTSR
jgi:hypothetical protein